MNFLLDTNFIIGILRGYKDFIYEYEKVSEEKPRISAITVCEIYAGCRESEIRITEELLSELLIIPVSKFIAREAGENVYHYSQRGKKIHNEDAIIGATPKIHHLVLITQNVKDFPMLYPSQIEGFPE